ncbi:hypothetical protein Aperf_G00000065186 [Anoplocephala perfoliata]
MQAAIMNPEENTVVHINTAAESDATRINRDAIDEGGLLLEEAMQAARIEPREEGTVLSSVEEELVEEEEDGEDLAEAETYADYVPAKLHYGRRHPHSVVESSTLSAVNPPEIRYTLNLPWEIIESGAISSVQLEAVVYACQRHESILPNKQRAGFLIGE